MKIREKTQKLLSALTHDAYERNEVMALSLLSALAGESIFLLGVPGVGKSMMARKLKTAFSGARSFEYLMSRFSTPDEIFGPVSITKLRENDVYERITKGYLPESEIIFLDEIWKAGPAIQNSLLTVLNEKVYRNGDTEIKLPLRGIIAASNELPAEGEGLEALWDRFLLRYVVKPIERRENFIRLVAEESIDNTGDEEIEPFTDEDCAHLDRLVQESEIPHEIIDLLYDLREMLSQIGVEAAQDTSNDSVDLSKYYVSDRRWRKIAHVMKVSACINGRTSVDVSDFMLLSHMVWNSDECYKACCGAIAQCVVRHKLRELLADGPSKSLPANPDKLMWHKADNKYYIVDCNGYSFKIKIEDYETMLANSRKLYFAREINEGELQIADAGPIMMQVYQEGYVCINSFNSPLRREGGKYVNNAIKCRQMNVNDVYEELLDEINANMFVVNGGMCSVLRAAFNEYEKKFKHIQR